MEIEIILNSSIRKLGTVGSLVKTKAGYGRYLINSGVALPATKSNKEVFEKKKNELIKTHNKNIENAKKIKIGCDGQWISIIKSANYDGSLYGSITTNDIYEELRKIISSINRKIIQLNQVIRRVGVYDLKIVVYDDIDFVLKVNVASSIGEAEQKKQSYISNLIKKDTEKKTADMREKFDNKNNNN